MHNRSSLREILVKSSQPAIVRPWEFYDEKHSNQLVKTDGIQGFQFGNQKKQETSVWQQRSIVGSKLEIDFEFR